MKIIILNFKKKIFDINNPFFVSIIKHSPKYFGASLISALAGVLMTKYYTAVFSPVEFGILSLYLTLFQYMQNLIGFSVDASYQRVYFDYNGKDRVDLLSTVFVFISGSVLFWGVVAVMFKDIVVSSFGGSSVIYSATFLMAVFFLYVNVLSRIGYNEHLSTMVFRQGTIQTFINHFCSFIFISYLKLGILGRQIGQMLAYGVNAAAYLFALKKIGKLDIGWRFRTDIFRRILFFAIPAFSTTVLAASLSYLDRIFLNYYHGAKEVGIFSLAYTIGQAISLIVEAISMALIPTLMKELAEDYDANINKLKHFDKIFCGTLIFMGIVLILFSNIIIQVLANQNYQHAAKVFPFIVVAFILGGFYKTVSAVLSFHSIVRFYPWLTILSFGINAMLNYLLIPRFHEIGAAYSFSIGVLIYSMIMHLIAREYFYNPYKVLISYCLMFIMITGLFFYSTNII